MERQQAKCPNCGSTEFILPVIDEMAWLHARDNPTVTVTCTHCSSKYQTAASVNMVKAKEPAPVQISFVQASPTATTGPSNLGLKFIQTLAHIAAVLAGIVTIIALIGAYMETQPDGRTGLICTTVVFAGLTFLFTLMARSLKKRIMRY